MKLRSAVLAAAFALAGTSVIAGPIPLACAGEGPDAALVVDTGNAEYKYCVALDAKTVSGLRLIELAAQQHGLSYSLGYQGQAVCMLAGIGSTEEECFQGGEPFWGYWHGTSSGGWTWSGSGAGSASIGNGDVEGWSWGTGNDGSSHQAPSSTTHEAVCGPEESGGGVERGRPRSKGDGGASAGGGGDGGSTGRATSGGDVEPGGGPGSPAPVLAAGEGDDPAEQSNEDRRKTRKGAGRDRGKGTKAVVSTAIDPAPYVTSTPTDRPRAAPAKSSSEGPPAAGIAALLVTVCLGVAGAWFVKRKHVSGG